MKITFIYLNLISLGLLFAPGELLAGGCGNGSVSVNIATGQDLNGDGNDDHWRVLSPGTNVFVPAPIGLPVEGWRGNLANTGTFLAGFRYPVLGEGRWLLPGDSMGTYVYELDFDLDGCPNPTLSGEWAADNGIEIFLNGMPVGIASNPNARPPLPWLSNAEGIDDPNADPLDGLLHPTCDPPPFRCDERVDEFRDIHYFEITDPSLFNLNGQNTLTVNVVNGSGPSGLLITGGGGTSVLTGASVRCCLPERAVGAVPEANLGVVLTGPDGPVQPGVTFAYTIDVTNHGPSIASGVTVIDYLSPQLQFLASSPSAPYCSESNGEVVCVIGPMDPGATATITLDVQMQATTPIPLANEVRVMGSHVEPSPDPNPNTAAINGGISQRVPTLSVYGFTVLLLGLLTAALVMRSKRKPVALTKT